MRFTVALIRHGKTKGNIEHRYTGCRTDEDLDLIGINEINERLDRIKAAVGNPEAANFYSSPMIRCIHTLKLIFGDREYSVVNDFREIDFGVFENHNYDELNGRSDYQAWIDSNGTMDYPEGEKRESFIERNITAFYHILETEYNRVCVSNDFKISNIENKLDNGTDKNDDTKDQTGIVIVCHGGTIMSILSYITGKDYYDFQIENAGGFCLSIDYDEGRYSRDRIVIEEIRSI